MALVFDLPPQRSKLVEETASRRGSIQTLATIPAGSMADLRPNPTRPVRRSHMRPLFSARSLLANSSSAWRLPSTHSRWSTIRRCSSYGGQVKSRRLRIWLLATSRPPEFTVARICLRSSGRGRAVPADRQAAPDAGSRLIRIRLPDMIQPLWSAPTTADRPTSATLEKTTSPTASGTRQAD